MADETPLRISCTDCPGTTACDDCLVHFFLAERDAAVVTLAGQPTEPAAGHRLPPDLANVLALLEAAGLAPQLLEVSDRGAARAS
jgi:hypothetical protein